MRVAISSVEGFSPSFKLASLLYLTEHSSGQGQVHEEDVIELEADAETAPTYSVHRDS